MIVSYNEHHFINLVKFKIVVRDPAGLDVLRDRLKNTLKPMK